MRATNITPEHERAFEALTSGMVSNFALFSCFLNGKPTVAIVSIARDEAGDYLIAPLFVAYTREMKLTDHEGVECA